MQDTIRDFLGTLANRRSPRTAKAYGAVLASFAAFLGGPPSSADRRSAEAFLGRPARDGGPRSPATWNHELAALRAFGRYAVRELGLAADPSEGIPFLKEAPRDPAVLSVFELRRLFGEGAKLGDGAARIRSHAILALLSQLGLRVHEAVALDLDQIDMPSSTLVGIRGKGGAVHDLPLNAPTIRILSAWLTVRMRIARPAEAALFVSSRGVRVSVRSVQRLVARLARATGTAKHVTPHTLRHSCATISLTLGSDLSTVGELLRHSDLNTTRKYLHLVDERRREAVRRLGTAIPADLFSAPGFSPGDPPGSGPPQNGVDAQGDFGGVGCAA